jgi:hypothetical protein
MAARQRDVASMTSFLTLVTTAAPDHESSAGMTNELVLPVWVGPTTSNELRDSSRTTGPYAMPRQVRRPSTGRSLDTRHDPHSAIGVDERAVARVGLELHDGPMCAVTDESSPFG